MPISQVWLYIIGLNSNPILRAGNSTLLSRHRNSLTVAKVRLGRSFDVWRFGNCHFDTLRHAVPDSHHACRHFEGKTSLDASLAGLDVCADHDLRSHVRVLDHN